MRVLVVGLGSMGKRRVRNLQALGVRDVAGFDVRADRRAEAVERYGIRAVDDFGTALEEFRPDALVISTSPAHHLDYARLAAARRLPCFIEASVVDAEGIRTLAEQVAVTGVIMAPSCTMRYFAGPRQVKELVRGGAIGRTLNVNYQTGQYLPDWHPWERIEDFYVSQRETGGCREILPFELTWLNDVFGTPTPLACVKAKRSEMPADIDDVYHCLLRYDGGVLANITVEVLSRPHATRELRVLGTEGMLVFSADENCVRYAAVGTPGWTRFDLGGGRVEAGYINPEEPYIAEVRDYLAAVERHEPARFPNTLRDDYRVLQTLYQLEALSDGR